MTDWIEVPLSAIAANDKRAFAMGPFGSNIKAENYRPYGVPVLRGTNLGEAGEAPFIAEDFVFLSQQKADELASSIARPGDVVFVAQGTVGKVGIVPSGIGFDRFVLSQNLMKVTVSPDLADPTYVFYFFRSKHGQHEILSRVNPTGVPCISKPLASLRQFKVLLPSDVGEQRAIAAILGALDDKIELNRRMNRTLEAMARALFQSWFVDFDPVRAKAEGRETGLPEEIAALFPDRLVESVLGEIPEGWRIGPIADLATVVGGGTPSTKEPSYWLDGQHYWATPKDLSALTTPVLLETERRITDAGLRQIGSGLLPPGTVLLSSRAPIGYLAISEVPVAINQGFIAMLPVETVPAIFLLYWARCAHDEIVSRANGSTFLEISKANFRPILVVTPAESILSTFERAVRPLHDRIISNERESKYLAKLRDSLLPSLLSGQLRVTQIERVVS